MTKKDAVLMAKYGITSEQKTVYYYEKHKYDKLEDAVNYAKIVESKENDDKSDSINKLQETS